MPPDVTNCNVGRILREIVDSLVLHVTKFMILAELFRDYIAEGFNERVYRISHIFHATPTPTQSPLAQSACRAALALDGGATGGHHLTA